MLINQSIYNAIVNTSFVYLVLLIVGYLFRTQIYTMHLQKMVYKLMLAFFIGIFLILPISLELFNPLFLYYIILALLTIYIDEVVPLIILLFIIASKLIIGNINIELFGLMMIFYYTTLLIRFARVKLKYKVIMAGLVSICFINLEMNVYNYPFDQIVLLNLFSILNIGFMFLLLQLIIQYNKIFLTTKRLATIDRDSNLYNRIYFNKLYMGKKVKFSMAIIDIDLFKNYEQLYGYNITKQMVQNLSKLMLKNLKDICFVYRYNYDKFYITINSSDNEKVINCFKRLKLEVENTEIKIDDYTIKFTISIGIKFNQNKVQSEELIVETKNALQESKILGRNKITVA